MVSDIDYSKYGYECKHYMKRKICSCCHYRRGDYPEVMIPQLNGEEIYKCKWCEFTKPFTEEEKKQAIIFKREIEEERENYRINKIVEQKLKEKEEEEREHRRCIEEREREYERRRHKFYEEECDRTRRYNESCRSERERLGISDYPTSEYAASFIPMTIDRMYR